MNMVTPQGQFKNAKVVHLVICAVIASFLLSACRSATPPAGEPSPARPTDAPTIPTMTTLPPGWTKIEPGGETRCAHDTPYAYWVRPGLTNDVFIYFQGGGGCYDAETCGMSGSYKDAVTDNDNPELNIGGVFNLDNPDNPFRDHTMLFVPYCTGDVHSGNLVRTYTPASGKSFDIYHRGYVNAAAALEWVYANVEQPDSIFVTGCSAGGIGSLLHAPHLIRHYPDTPIVQLSDSSGGLVSVVPWDIDADHAAGQYFPDWIPGMQQEIAHAFTIATYTIALADYYPTYTFGQYNSANDRTQTRYFVADGGPSDGFAAGLQASLDEIHRQAGNFYSYTDNGDRHCILKHAAFYSRETNGVRVRDWVAALANQEEVERVNAITGDLETTLYRFAEQLSTEICPPSVAIEPRQTVENNTVSVSCGVSMGHSLSVNLTHFSNLSDLEQAFQSQAETGQIEHFHDYPLVTRHQPDPAYPDQDGRRTWVWQAGCWLIDVSAFNDTAHVSAAPKSASETVYQMIESHDLLSYCSDSN